MHHRYGDPPRPDCRQLGQRAIDTSTWFLRLEQGLRFTVAHSAAFKPTTFSQSG